MKIKVYEVYYEDLNDFTDSIWFSEEKAKQRVLELENDKDCPSAKVEIINWEIEDSEDYTLIRPLNKCNRNIEHSNCNNPTNEHNFSREKLTEDRWKFIEKCAEEVKEWEDWKKAELGANLTMHIPFKATKNEIGLMLYGDRYKK